MLVEYALHCALVSVVSDLRVGDCVGGRVCHVF